MADTAIALFTDGATANATDRLAAARSPFGVGDDRYVTPAYIKDYILGLANTWADNQTLTAGKTFGWSDVLFARDAAATLALRNSTNAQTLRVYSTYTDASNNEGFQVRTTAGLVALETFANGTGTIRDLYISVGAANSIWRFAASNGHFYCQNDNLSTIGGATANRPASVYAASNILVTGTGGGVGYGTGAGGTVTQATSRTTGVTLNKICGAITMFSAAGSTTAATFTVTNSMVAAGDIIDCNQKSGTNLYQFLVTAVAAGSFNITFFTTGGTATDAPVINFAVTKAVTA